MGNSRPYDKDNPPVVTSPLQQKDGFGINIGQDNGGGTFMPLPNTFLPGIPYVESTQQEIPQTSGRMIGDFMMRNSLQNPRDSISNNISSNQLRSCSVSDVPFPEGNAIGFPHYPNQDYSLMPHTAMNRTGFSSIQSQPTNRNFMLKKNAAGGYQMVGQAGEARIGNVNRPQTNGEFGSLGGNSFMVPYTQNSGQQLSGNHANVDGVRLQEKVDEKFGGSGDSMSMLSLMQNREHTQTCDVVKVSEDQRGFQEQIDGSFLSLGIGGNQPISKHNYSSQEIANKLEEAAPPSHVQQTARTSSNLGQNLDAGVASFQTNAGAFLNPVRGADSRTLSNNDIEAIGSANGWVGSSPFQVMQSPQYALQQHMPTTPGSRNFSSVNNRNVGYTELDHRTLRSNQPGSSGAIGGNLAGFLNSRQVNLPGPASVSAKPALIPSRIPLDMHNLYVSAQIAAQRAAESAVTSPSLTLGGSSTRSNRAGPSITGLEYGGGPAAQNSGIPQIVRAQPPGHLATRGSPLSQRIGVPVDTSGAAQAAASGLFPKRLGVDVNPNGVSRVAERDPRCSGGVDLQTAGKLYRPSDTRPNLLDNLLRAPPSIGWAEGAIPIRYPTNPHGPSFVTGGSQNVPAQFSKGPAGFASSNGQVIPVATAHRRPSHKRSAMWSPPATQWVQRQKIGPSTVVHPSKTHRALAVPPIQKAAPAVSRIKWEGCDEPRQPTGEKCYICKRDLSFTHEGPVYQPAVPPPVAVLPCGHTFHDECLQKITPEDQAKEPPCIPCAVNEN